MKKVIMEGLVGLCMLAILPSCNTSLLNRQLAGEMKKLPPAVAEENMPAAGLVRHAEIPLLQVDALTVYKKMVNYLTLEPKTGLADSVQTEKLTAYIGFPAGNATFDLKYGNNRAELEKLKERLLQLHGAKNKIRSICLTGYASPDGSSEENERLAGNRVVGFKDYLEKLPGLAADVRITIDWGGEDWAGLRELVAKSNRSYSIRVLTILDTCTDADIRRKQIKALDKGAVYKDIERSFFSKLRRMELVVASEETLVSKDGLSPVGLQELTAKVWSNPDQVTLDEFLQVASLYRPGTEQYREVYELAAYRYPGCREVLLNAAAAALALGDRESARYFLQQCSDDPRSYINQGVLLLMEGDTASACEFFRKAIPLNPRLARENLMVASGALSFYGI